MIQMAFHVSQFNVPRQPAGSGVAEPEPERSSCAPERPDRDRIAVCHVAAGADWAGAEAQVATLLGWLGKKPEVDLHAIVFYDRRLARELRNAGAEVYLAGDGHVSFPRLISECSRFVKSRKIQLLHSHNYKENLLALALSCTCPVPHLVRTEHGLAEPYSVIRNLKHWCVLAADRVAAKYTPDRIIGVSSDLGEYWKKHADPRKVMVLRNGVDLERISSRFTAAEAKLRLGIPGDGFVVGMVARLELIKRLDLFVSTAAYLAARIPNASFVIAGTGRQEQRLRQLVLDAGLQERLKLLGQCNDAYDVLRAMDVLLICSDHEGVPMVMLEAMTLGAAVVSREVGGIPEVLGHRSTGILVPSGTPQALGDACLELFEKPELRAHLARAAREEIRQKYSAEKNAEAVLQVYRSLCATPAAGNAAAGGQC